MTDSRRRVLHVLEATVGGTKRHVFDLATGLRAAGWDVEVACPRVRENAYGDVSFCTDLAAAGVPMHEIDMRRASLCHANAVAIFRLRALIAKGGYAIVHGHSSIGGAVARAAALLCPRHPRIVYTPNGFAFLTPGSAMRRRLYLAIERVLGRRTDRVIAVSATEAEVAATQGIASGPRLVTIPNGIDFNVEAPGREPDMPWRARWNGAPIVGNVARLTAQKDPFTWLEVAARVAAVRSDVRFVWVGGGEHEDAFRAATSRLRLDDKLLLLPYRPDARELLARFDLFLLTSAFEGLPYVLIEALASAVPVVATAVVGVQDIVRDGETGLLAAAADIAGLTARVLRLLSDHHEARRLAAAGRQEVLARFSVSRMVASNASLYESVLA